MTYSLQFRKKALSVRTREKLTIAQMAERFDVGVASVVGWLKDIEPRLIRYKFATKIDKKALAEDIQQFPDVCRYERAKRLKVSERCVGFALKRLGITYKTNLETSRGRRRKAMLIPKKIAQFKADNRPIVYVDESGFA